MAVKQTKNILAEHWLNVARDKSTNSESFRNALANLGAILFSEAINEAKLRSKTLVQKKQIKTPLIKTQANTIDQKDIYIVPVLRAGLGMLSVMKDLVPNAKIAHVGLYRNEKTLQPVWYLDKLPKKIGKRSVFFILEPMLATGGTIATVLERIEKLGVRNISVISALIAKSTVKALEAKFPHVNFYVGAIDPLLNSKGYIVPGLGDAGDRIFNI
jgi:uracil phosphoribosyltransferase